MTLIKKIGVGILLFLAAGFLWPEKRVIPIEGATVTDWNKDTFWFEPWGRSGVHKGIDIFASKGKPVLSSTSGLVLYTGNISMGGNVVLILGPKWRLHYYAHLEKITTSALSIVKFGSVIGSNGDSGNAKGKPAHLHYSIVTLIPYPWRIDFSTQGWKKMFFLDPGELLKDA